MIQKKSAVFFDRDGVLNIDRGYTYRQQDFEWMPGAIQTIKHFNDLGYLVFVITNQSGIARGFYTEQDVHALHAFMNQELAKNDSHIDEFYYCPHHPQGVKKQYSFSCDCRKPEPGMLRQVLKKWDIDIQHSLMIGDRVTDMQAAEAAGIKGYLFDDANLYEFVLRIIGQVK